MTKVAWFYDIHEATEPLLHKPRLKNDRAIHDWLGISAETLYDKYPKKKPRPFDPNSPEGCWIRYLNDVQNMINPSKIGE